MPTAMSAEPAALSVASAARPSEALVAAIWQRQWLVPGPLLDSAGRALQVVYPGRRWGGPGPDFQGAILALDDGTLVHGDVEVHLRAADWWSHGHDCDPAYNRSVLQVVLWAGRAARRQDGQELPTLELAAYLARPLESLAAQLVAEREPVEPVCLDSPEELLRLVDRAAVERFLEKAGHFESELAALSGAEVVYRAVLVALGYSANVEACARLAELVPWDLALRVARGPAGAASLRALLLGAAGLLPSQRGLPVQMGEPRRLEALWSELAPELGRQPLGTAAWRLAAGRPASGPVRRLVGAAELLSRWAIVDAPEPQLDAILASPRQPKKLVELFRARTDEPYWRSRVDFGESGGQVGGALIGNERAVEVVVNVLLPFGYASGRLRGRPDLSAAALLAYRTLPGGGWNRVSRAMAAQLLGSEGARLCRGAARKQGLLHLYHQWCWERRCEACPAGERRRARWREVSFLPQRKARQTTADRLDRETLERKGRE
jgi:hypothetical protein